MFVENKFVVMEQNKIILYQDDNEITRVAVRFADEDLWLTQNQLAEIYCTSRENITMHIKNIYADEELLLDSTSKDFLLVRSAKVCTSYLRNLMQILAALTILSALGSLFTEDKFESQRYRSLQDRRHIIANNENC